jgi:hypothetical protein
VVVLLPMTTLAGVLLIRSAISERAALEARLLQVASDLADDLDRELSNLITTLKTLATSPALQANDLAAFHAQATAAVAGWGAIFLVDPESLQQVLNTLVPWGTPLPKTGDAATVTRVRDTRRPQVSDYFVGVVSQQPTFNVDIAIVQGDNVRYVMLLGLEPAHLLPILEAQKLDAGWISVIVDRQGVVLARSHNQAHVSGKSYSIFGQDLTIDSRGLVVSQTVEGQHVLRAGARSQVAGWLAMVSIPIVVAEAPLRRSLQQWGAAAALALCIALGAAWWFGRALERPMRAASKPPPILDTPDPSRHCNRRLPRRTALWGRCRARALN